jgi:hypothetical protein
MATGFADGTLFEYEYVNTGQKFFYRQDPSSDTIIQETGLKWLEREAKPKPLQLAHPNPIPLRKKGNEFKKMPVVVVDKNQKTLDDYVTK